MLAVALLVASIALADSINPSTIIPALWLASAPSGGRLASYTLGVFSAYMVGGLVLLLGPGRVLIASLRHVHGPVEHALQAIGGILTLAFAFALWRSRRSTSDRLRRRRLHTRASAFAMGAGIMLVELPTAFMYFGAISAILAGHISTPAGIALLIAYNAIFVAPLVAFLVIRRVAGAQTDRWIASVQARVGYVGQLILTGVAGAAGAVLLALGLDGLLLA